MKSAPSLGVFYGEASTWWSIGLWAQFTSWHGFSVCVKFPIKWVPIIHTKGGSTYWNVFHSWAMPSELQNLQLFNSLIVVINKLKSLLYRCRGPASIIIRAARTYCQRWERWCKQSSQLSPWLNFMAKYVFSSSKILNFIPTNKENLRIKMENKN